MKNNLFITATNTEVGKTIISSLICNTLLTTEKKVGYYKPIQTGSETGFSTDCDFLNTLFGNNKNFSSKASYILKKAASPHYSSKLENILIDKETIKNDFQFFAKKNEFVVVEGAGGLLVPINEKDFFIADIPKILDLNVVLVANAGLGTINNIYLNHFFCSKKNINLKVIILIYYGERPTDIELNNFETIKKNTDIKYIYLIKSLKNVDTENKKYGNFFDYDFLKIEEIMEWFS